MASSAISSFPSGLCGRIGRAHSGCRRPLTHAPRELPQWQSQTDKERNAQDKCREQNAGCRNETQLKRIVVTNGRGDGLEAVTAQHDIEITGEATIDPNGRRGKDLAAILVCRIIAVQGSLFGAGQKAADRRQIDERARDTLIRLQ